jgi:hypothetical protein
VTTRPYSPPVFVRKRGGLVIWFSTIEQLSGIVEEIMDCWGEGSDGGGGVGFWDWGCRGFNRLSGICCSIIEQDDSSSPIGSLEGAEVGGRLWNEFWRENRRWCLLGECMSFGG